MQAAVSASVGWCKQPRVQRAEQTGDAWKGKAAQPVIAGRCQQQCYEEGKVLAQTEGHFEMQGSLAARAPSLLALGSLRCPCRCCCFACRTVLLTLFMFLQFVLKPVSQRNPSEPTQ